MWYICTIEYYSAIKRNKIGSFVETWMDLETVIQSEVRKRKTELEESDTQTSEYTTKLQESRQYGTGTKMEI